MTSQKKYPWTTWLVGGAVRDELLGRKVSEYDWVVTGAAKEHLIAAGFRQVGRDFPVFLAPGSGEEYALARTERKISAGHTGFKCDFGPEITLEEDLQRRDLTINAIARATDGELIDPYNGQADLINRTLRHVSTAFAEDPLRVLRVARFAAQLAPWGFSVAPETTALLTAMATSGELDSLTPERVWRETQKALAAPNPNRYFSLLADWGALHVITLETSNNWDSSWGAQALMAWLKEKHPNPIQTYGLLFVGFYANKGADALQQTLKDLKIRLKIPNRYHRMATRLGAIIASGAQPDAATLATLFERIDLYRNSGHLPLTLEAASWLAKVANWRWSAQLIRQCAKVANAVTTDTIRAAGLEGEEIGQQLAIKRQDAIATLLKGD